MFPRTRLSLLDWLMPWRPEVWPSRDPSHMLSKYSTHRQAIKGFELLCIDILNEHVFGHVGKEKQYFTYCLLVEIKFLLKILFSCKCVSSKWRRSLYICLFTYTYLPVCPHNALESHLKVSPGSRLVSFIADIQPKDSDPVASAPGEYREDIETKMLKKSLKIM